MRLTSKELKEITGRTTPAAQASWFKRHFKVQLEYDTHGVILTKNVFDSIVAKRYGVSANDPGTPPRPTVRLRHA